MIPRNRHVGTNSTTLDASFGDPATIVLSAEIRIATFVEHLRQPWWFDAVADPRLDLGIRGGIDVAARRSSRTLQRNQSAITQPKETSQ